MTTTIPYYITDKGLLVRLKISSPERYRINDKPLTATFHPQWWTVEGESQLQSYSVHAGTKAVNERYVLINHVVEGLEPVIRREDVERDDSGWAGRHLGLDSLYKYESESEDLGYAPEPFEGQLLGTVTLMDLGDPTAFSYQLHAQRFEERADTLGYKDIFQEYIWLDQRIGVDEIAKAMVPDVAWHLYPCSVDSNVAYRIIRSHVKDNIDPRFSQVTSDYDFCFTVKKKVRVVPFIREWEVNKPNGGSYRPPRFQRKTVEYELHEVFEMTNAKDRYRGYTVAEGFSGASLKDLAENIDRYLADLMAVINAPLTRCPRCEGRGVTDYFKLPTNERQKFGLESA